MSLDEHAKAYQGGSVYDFDNELILRWYCKRIAELSESQSSLLELGVGYGYSTPFLASCFSRHVVLDGSRAVIDHFKISNPDCQSEVVETYFEEFDTNETFDVIVLGFILEHVDDPSLILKRYSKFLAKNGKMYVVVPNAESLNRRLGVCAGDLKDIRELSQADEEFGHQRYYTVKSIADEVTAAGYSVNLLEGLYLKPFMTQQIQSLNLDERYLQALCEVGADYPELCCALLLEAVVNA